MSSSIKLIAFDADDTLWANQPLFDAVEEDLRGLLTQYGSPEVIDAALIAAQAEYISLMGYGAKGFVLSMIEVAIKLTDGQVPGSAIQQIIDQGKHLLSYPIALLDGVEETLHKLREQPYTLMVLTKGDLFDQESKLARSGIGSCFDHVEIVSEKDEATYRRIMNRYAVQPAEFVMIGNSLKSDILPVVDVGGRAIYVPYHTTARHERVQKDTGGYEQLEHLNQVTALLSQWLSI